MTEQLVELRADTDSSQVSLPYILLEPGYHPPRSLPPRTLRSSLVEALESASRSKIVAVDFETRGNDYSLPLLEGLSPSSEHETGQPETFELIGIGMAWDTGNCYFDWRELDLESRNQVANFLSTHPGLIAHNVYFDAGVAAQCIGTSVSNWHTCTYSLLAFLANESTVFRKWGLKTAQVELLGWEEKGDVELDRWLVLNGYYKGTRRKDTSVEYLTQQFETGGLRAEKGQMWRAPPEVLGKYCCLDAESTYLLYTEILRPALERFPGLVEHMTAHMTLISELVRQKILGLEMDTEGMDKLVLDLQGQIEGLTERFLSDPRVVPVVRKLEAEKRLPLESSPPERLKKDGGVSKNYTNWQARVEQARAGRLPQYNFNVQSGDQMRRLLYEELGYPIRILTDSGLASVGSDSFKHMGNLGAILLERADPVKQLSYVSKYQELTQHRSTMHPSFRVPGTTSGRLSGKEPNLQQIPKTGAVMSLFRSRPGTVWVDLDFAALEAMIATEFTLDPNMLALYDNDAPDNDIHLFVAAGIPGMRERIAATGYDRYNPTRESLDRAKEECKRDRSITKSVVYACQYGAGIDKVMQTLEEDDVFLSRDEVAVIHNGYHATFPEVRNFGKKLGYQWQENDGWILNGMGRPMAVPETEKKDMLSRFIQSTGHDILTRYVQILVTELRRREVPYEPIIIDFHDASTVEVPEAYAGVTVEVFQWSMAELNRQLGGRIRFRGIPTVGVNLAQVKECE